MKNLPLLIGSLLLTLLVVVGVAVVFTNKASAPITPVESKLLVSEGVHSKGSNEAKVTLVEFSDLQCPACRAVQPLVKEILDKNGDKVRFVYRHFPLRSIHPNAALAARASEAAHAQDKFWEYHDKLFEQQVEWAGESDPRLKFLDYAKQLGLDVAKFETDLKDSKLDARIAADEADGNTIGISGTPTFFVNGIQTDAGNLVESIDALLAEEAK